MGPCRTGQEGACLHAGWKSNVSQQGVKAEFIEEKANTDGLSVPRLGKERKSLGFVRGVEVVMTIVDWCICPLRHAGTGQNEDNVRMPNVNHLLPEVRGLENV